MYIIQNIVDGTYDVKGMGWTPNKIDRHSWETKSQAVRHMYQNLWYRIRSRHNYPNRIDWYVDAMLIEVDNDCNEISRMSLIEYMRKYLTSYRDANKLTSNEIKMVWGD